MIKTFLKVRPALWVVLSVTLFGWGMFTYGRWLWFPAYYKFVGRHTVEEAAAEIAPTVEPRIRLMFGKAGLPYPPKKIALLAFKEEKLLELWSCCEGDWVHVKSFTILAASGGAGPKLRQGDRQVPEGVYRIEQLDPNSSCYLSLKLDFPNERDRARAELEGRTGLGSDIFIHGSDRSFGCLAMGDDAIEELFLLAHRVAKDNVTVIIAPRDLRHLPPPTVRGPAWITELYADLREHLKPFPPNDTSEKPTQQS